MLEHIHRVVDHAQRYLGIPLEQFMVNLSPRDVLLYLSPDEGQVVLNGPMTIFTLWKGAVFQPSKHGFGANPTGVGHALMGFTHIRESFDLGVLLEPPLSVCLTGQ